MEHDDFLIECIKNDNQKALESLYKKYFYPLCRFAKSFVNDPLICEEVVSDVFFNIWKGRKKLHLQKNLKPYLFTATRNQALKTLKKEKAAFFEAQIEDNNCSEITADEPIEYQETLKTLEAIIEGLPPQRKLIFKMNRMEGLNYSEIAKILQISIYTVQNQMVAAMKYLSKYRSKFYSIF